MVVAFAFGPELPLPIQLQCCPAKGLILLRAPNTDIISGLEMEVGVYMVLMHWECVEKSNVCVCVRGGGGFSKL